MTQIVNVTTDSFSDVTRYEYSCGHHYTIPNSMIVKHRGNVAPPVCPTCHGQKAIDQLEADNWRHDPKWPGYVSFGTPLPKTQVSAALKRLMAVDAARTHQLGQINDQWLDKQLNTVRSRAWH